MVIIRPRGYDFLYSSEELQVMLHDIQTARALGADGVVIGCLNRDGRVDVQPCQALVAAAGPLDITFHRAFDMTRDLSEALEDVCALGIRRVLTSGGRQDVPAGADQIATLVGQAKGRVSIMPGGGVTAENLAEIVAATGVKEIHLSARDTVRSGMLYRNQDCFMGAFSRANEYEWREARAEVVRRAKAALAAAVRD